jgi:hypothetical protein
MISGEIKNVRREGVGGSGLRKGRGIGVLGREEDSKNRKRK